MTVPQSCTTTYLSTSSVKVCGSTSTIMACTPLAVAPPDGPKYCVDSSPGSVPGFTAPRIGLALTASSPSLTDCPGTPTTDTLPSAISRSSAAHKGAGAPVELIGIAGDDIDVANRHAELVGGDLGEHGEMPLPLRADPGRYADFAVVLHLHLGAFVRPDAGA